MIYPVEDFNEPVGSCENCGANLYEDDDADHCNECIISIFLGGDRGGEVSEI